MDTATIVSAIPGIVIGSDAAGTPIRLMIGDNRVPEAAWRAWLCANANSRLISDGLLRRIG